MLSVGRGHDRAVDGKACAVLSRAVCQDETMRASIQPVCVVNDLPVKKRISRSIVCDRWQLI